MTCISIVFHRTGKSHSEYLMEQKSKPGSSFLGGPLRFKNCLVLWVQCDQTVLETRCDKRVDKMIDRGMIQELEAFHKDYNAKRDTPADYTVGIFQSIGFKEFHNYLILSDEEKHSEPAQVLFKQGVDQLKLVTRQYSRRQLKWIRSRFLNPNRVCPDVYAVDSTQPELWDQKCLEPAKKIVQVRPVGTKIDDIIKDFFPSFSSRPCWKVANLMLNPCLGLPQKSLILRIESD